MNIPDVSIKKILYVTDLSQSAYHAFAYAANLAGAYDAELSMLHVIEEIPDFDNKVVGYISRQRWSEIKRLHEDEAHSTLTGKLVQSSGPMAEVLGELSNDACRNIPGQNLKIGELLVKRGIPVEEILNQMQTKDFDLLVMGTHGHGRFADAMMGSTSRRVLRRCPKPVLVVRLPE